MVPQTVLTFAAFLVLVLPGLAFERGYRSVTPPRRSSAFQEASRVAATGLLFSAATAVALAWLGANHNEMLPDPDLWVAGGQAYVRSHYQDFVRLAFLQVLVACSLAWITAQSLRLLRPAKTNVQAWWAEVRPDFLPPRLGIHSEASAMWRILEPGLNEIQVVALRTKDGSFLQGDLSMVDVGESFDTGTIVIAARGATVKKAWDVDGYEPPEPWSRIVIPLCEVTELWTFTRARNPE